mmetsp:Transcript_9900/g.11582  ORF Transcript_9900/g.11582 Transcript_9900/m.11582 type:complete len:368 (-) Transcript_9900:276-1379(-)|eukprot:CAMPEP_0198248366 /NCGR_PEP_ID=MMETSP1447-20131203/121_1 /TAXON_ID=420782 /ORGANISM="Chaetoceros dichaeta, Strain CCMP1751" /LENGTH=367 /DNA_ID=CAMNT_0043932717 /DNA_START=119 /DNA_END=1222 /DNA_ORIENTATION=-
MKIILAVLSAWATSSAAHNGIDLSVDIPAESKLGNNILSKARRVADAEEEEADYTWIANYSIKFKSSHSIDVFGGEGAEESSSPAGVEHLATFQLCPNDSKCSSCSKSGEYVMKLRDFVEAYAEMKKELSEAACEAVENDCNCDYYDDEDNCFAKCYADAGLDDCGDDDEFEIDKYMECEEAEFNNGYYNVNYYIGPVIAKGGSAVYLDVFTDASCTVPAESGTYLKFMGSELPYSKENKVSIVNDDCITCQAVEENDGDDQQNNYYLQASESCAQIYEEAGKCERKLKGKTSSVDNETCEFIHNRLPALERVYKRGGGSSATTAFMWFFAVTTLGASAGAYYFYTIGQRSNIKLGNGGSRANGRIL